MHCFLCFFKHDILFEIKAIRSVPKNKGEDEEITIRSFAESEMNILVL